MPATQIEERPTITLTLLQKIPDLVSSLEKGPNFQTELKTSIIPILIRFLNFNELSVPAPSTQIK